MEHIFADLHTHTTCSDGVYKPEEIIEMAIKYGLKAIAISDHDSVEGIEPAIKASNGQVEVVPSIELSCEHEGRDIHILGHFINHQDPTFIKAVYEYKNERVTRAKKIVENLNQAGIPISFQDIKDLAGDAAISRAHIGRIMLSKGYVSTHQEAFDNYLGDQCPTYVHKFKLSPEEAFKLVRDAGGLPFWAHPARMKLDHLIPEFTKKGLAGLEIYHPAHDEEEIKLYLEIAKENGLLISGGSDFHGSTTYACIGSHGIDEENFKKIKSSLN